MILLKLSCLTVQCVTCAINLRYESKVKNTLFLSIRLINRYVFNGSFSQKKAILRLLYIIVQLQFVGVSTELCELHNSYKTPSFET